MLIAIAAIYRELDEHCQSISLSPRATSVQHHSLASFWYIAGGFPEFKGHPRRLTLRIGGNRRLSARKSNRPKILFSVCCGGILGEIADNAINGSVLDTLVPKLKKLMMN